MNEDIFIKVERVITYGKPLESRFKLVCNGNFAAFSNIWISPLKGHPATPRQILPSHFPTIVFTSPISTITDIFITVHAVSVFWQQVIRIDLQHGTVFMDQSRPDALPIPEDFADEILSSFGIQRGRRVVNLWSLSILRVKDEK